MQTRAHNKNLDAMRAQIVETPKQSMATQQRRSILKNSAAHSFSPTENGAAASGGSMTNWQDEIKAFWSKIKEHTKSSLKLIKQDRIRGGLAFDEIFKDNFLRSVNSKICSAYEEFLKDEHFFDRCIDIIDTKQPSRVTWAIETIDKLPETEAEIVIDRRQSHRNAKPKRSSTDELHEHHPKRSSTMRTRASKNTTNQSNARAKTEVNHSMSSENCNVQTSQQTNASAIQVESSHLQKRMRFGRNAKNKLPVPIEELNVPQYSDEIMPKSKNENPKSNKAPPPRDQNDSESIHNEDHSLIVLDDICDVPKGKVAKINENGQDDTYEPQRKSRRIAQRLSSVN